jgi:hypothetical protein
MSKEQSKNKIIEREAEKLLMNMMNENSPKLLQFFLLCLGEQLEAANVEELSQSCEMNIKGKRYKVSTVTTLHLVQS